MIRGDSGVVDRWLRTLVQVSDEAIVVVDAEGRLLLWSQAAERLYGLKATAVLGRNVSEIWPDGAGTAVFLGQPDQEPSTACEAEFPRPNGPPVEVAVRRAAVLGSDGRAVAVIIRSTDRNEAQVADRLRESEERFRLSFLSSPIGKAIVGLNGQFLSVNSALCDIVGYRADELLAKTFQEITRPEDLKEDLAHVERLLKGEIPQYQMEKRYERKDGSVVWVQLNVTLVRARSGAPLYFLAQIQDITVRRQHSAAMEAVNEQLRVADELKTRFVANVSHELQSPLTVILGFADILAEPDGTPDPETLQTAVSAISRQARRLKRIVADLLALSRLDVGVSVEPEPLPLRSLLGTVLADSSDDPTRWELVVPEGLTAFADPDRLAQIIANLVANAERHGAPPYVLEVSRDEADTVAIRVSDHGAGVPPEFVPYLFERFARGDRSGSGEGSGLGLAISQGLARSQGGDIRYEPHEPSGATFVVTVPESASSARSAPGPHLDPALPSL